MSESFDPSQISYVAAMGAVRDRHPKAMTRATGKVLRRLDKHCRAILQRSTFCVIGTQGSDGADVSPRGDPAGFVRVLDDRHLLLPDRIGNNRFDSYANVFANPQVGLMFLVPGMAEVLRINGIARVTDVRVQRGLFTSSGHAEPITTGHVTYEVRAATGTVDQLAMSVIDRMRHLEADVARAVTDVELIVLDGLFAVFFASIGM